MRCTFETKRKDGGVQRCIVPTVNGKHVDGNPEHYSGNSHYARDGVWVRG